MLSECQSFDYCATVTQRFPQPLNTIQYIALFQDVDQIEEKHLVGNSNEIAFVFDYRDLGHNPEQMNWIAKEAFNVCDIHNFNILSMRLFLQFRLWSTVLMLVPSLCGIIFM